MDMVRREREWEERVQDSLIGRGASVARFSLTMALAAASLLVALKGLTETEPEPWLFWGSSIAVLLLVLAGILGIQVSRVVAYQRLSIDWLEWQTEYGDGTTPPIVDIQYVRTLREINSRSAQYLQLAMRSMLIGTGWGSLTLLAFANPLIVQG